MHAVRSAEQDAEAIVAVCGDDLNWGLCGHSRKQVDPAAKAALASRGDPARLAASLSALATQRCGMSWASDCLLGCSAHLPIVPLLWCARKHRSGGEIELG